MSEFTTKVTLVEKSIYGSIVDEDKFQGDHPSEIIEWLQELLARIPDEYRATAKVEIDSVGGYEGEHHSEITVSYYRPEDPEEADRRRRQQLERAAEQERLATARLAEARAMRERLAREHS